MFAVDAAAAIRVRAKLVNRAPIPSLEEIAPYRESLVLHTYAVEAVEHGRLAERRIAVYYWGIYAGVAQKVGRCEVGRSRRIALRPFADFPSLRTVNTSLPDEVDPSLPQFLAVDQELRLPGRGKKDGDYGGRVDDKLADLLALRHQVRLVACGDSRTLAGIDPRCFYADEDPAVPLAYNLATASSGIASFVELVDAYLLALPALEWVVFGFSPRMVNRNWKGRELDVLDSPGYRRDRERWEELWTDPPPLLLAGQIDWNDRPYGFHERGGRADAKNAEKVHGNDAWAFDRADWNRFEEAVARLDGRGVRVLVFTPPMLCHPARGAVDNDGTPRWAHRGTVARLRALRRCYPRFFFRDLHRDGSHGFPAELFGDEDHLNTAGAKRLTRRLEAIRRAPTWHDRLAIGKTRGGSCWRALRPRLRVYDDRDYRYGAVPTAFLDLPVLRTHNDDKETEEEEPVSFTVDRPVRVHVAIALDADRRPKWLAGFERAEGNPVLATDDRPLRLYGRDFPAGRIALGAPGPAKSMYSVILEPRVAPE